MRTVALSLCTLLLFCGMAYAKRLTVNVTTANIRSGPGTRYKVLWKVEQYHPVDTVKKKGSWYQFKDFEGDLGWIHEKLLSPMESVIVKKDNCNVRSGPGLDNSIRFRVEQGVPFKVLEHKGKWIHIQHTDGDKGWIHESLVW